MPKGIKKTTDPTASAYLPQPMTREEFVRHTATTIVYELVRHNGKVNPDYPTIAVKAANDLADQLGMGTGSPKKAKSTELINLVDTIDNED